MQKSIVMYEVWEGDLLMLVTSDKTEADRVNCGTDTVVPREWIPTVDMTTEWSSADTASIATRPFPFGYGADEDMARRAARVYRGPVYKRLVGPWVEVE